jgi:hypothetical protein
VGPRTTIHISDLLYLRGQKVLKLGRGVQTVLLTATVDIAVVVENYKKAGTRSTGYRLPKVLHDCTSRACNLIESQFIVKWKEHGSELSC